MRDRVRIAPGGPASATALVRGRACARSSPGSNCNRSTCGNIGERALRRSSWRYRDDLHVPTVVHMRSHPARRYNSRPGLSYGISFGQRQTLGISGHRVDHVLGDHMPHHIGRAVGRRKEIDSSIWWRGDPRQARTRYPHRPPAVQQRVGDPGLSPGVAKIAVAFLLGRDVGPLGVLIGPFGS